MIKQHQKEFNQPIFGRILSLQPDAVKFNEFLLLFENNENVKWAVQTFSLSDILAINLPYHR